MGKQLTLENYGLKKRANSVWRMARTRKRGAIPIANGVWQEHGDRTISLFVLPAISYQLYALISGSIRQTEIFRVIDRTVDDGGGPGSQCFFENVREFRRMIHTPAFRPEAARIGDEVRIRELDA